ncbi:HlyD family efflux transporter periplasmic adaptor subunit [Alkaliphilus crotonatoxidans]
MQSKTKKRKKKQGMKFSRIIISTIVILYFLARVFPLIGTTSQKTVVAEYGKIEELIAVTGLIARDERVLADINQGEANFFVSEGEKVAKGQKLAEIYREKLDERYQQELEIINERIEGIQDQQEETSIFQKDIEKIDAQISDLLKKIQQEIKQGNYDKIQQYQSQVEELAKKKNVIIGENSFAGKNLSELMVQKDEIEKKLNTALNVIVSETPGTIAFGSDGLEELITPNSIIHFTASDLEAIEKNHLQPKEKEAEETGFNENVMKIINNFQWSILCKLTEEEASGLEAGRRIDIRIRGEERDYSARIRQIVEDEDQWLMVLDLTDTFDGLYQLRTLEIDIVKNRFEGAMLPKEAIVETNQGTGVYRVNINGIVRFVPVQVKGRNEDYAILHDGSFAQKDPDTGESKNVSTINLYDEIVLNGSKINEGQKIR